MRLLQAGVHCLYLLCRLHTRQPEMLPHSVLQEVVKLPDLQILCLQSIQCSCTAKVENPPANLQASKQTHAPVWHGHQEQLAGSCT